MTKRYHTFAYQIQSQILPLGNFGKSKEIVLQKVTLGDEDSLSTDPNKKYKKRCSSQADNASCIKNNISKPNKLFKIAKERESIG